MVANAISSGADITILNKSTKEGIYSISYVKEHYYDLGGLISPVEKLYRRDSIDKVRFREDLSIGEDIVFNLSLFNQIDQVQFINFSGYSITDNPNSLTRSKLHGYDARLDEEFQKSWGNIHSAALCDAGIPEDLTTAQCRRGCSVWIFQKIKNLCYNNSPHPKKETFQRIKRLLDENRSAILQEKNPLSPSTHFIIKVCTIFNSARLTYCIFRLIIFCYDK